eukprot:CAMPEP_0204588686 /NCGR_PEP_ID=MMETSP0661-20131031/48757_1 /ASSEMBLY_ACC=CAM_ASM_000606 /TAXON_ID=109239 /ORGANISM="Alexandrium margalefi, Strain AMGDE01CS-322" /LENGTH=91 /DNA_ID=CAMNT_0051598517 /DNA_START=50 /DNA_END=325 /DNA_ORIENTATION=+
MFSPPNRVDENSGAAAAASGTTWPAMTRVERILDDVSDIWTPAVVICHKPGGGYDIEYMDQSVERDVNPYELRLRREQPADGEPEPAAPAA